MDAIGNAFIYGEELRRLDLATELLERKIMSRLNYVPNINNSSYSVSKAA
jgi:hypothetical protein